MFLFSLVALVWAEGLGWVGLCWFALDCDGLSCIGMIRLELGLLWIWY